MSKLGQELGIQQHEESKGSKEGSDYYLCGLEEHSKECDLPNSSEIVKKSLIVNESPLERDNFISFKRELILFLKEKGINITNEFRDKKIVKFCEECLERKSII